MPYRKLSGILLGLLVILGGLSGARAEDEWFGPEMTDVYTPPNLSAVVGRWSFNEQSGSQAQDSSGNSNHGTLHGARFVDSGINEQFGQQVNTGNALEFNGTSDYVEVNDSASLDIADEISLETWVEPGQIPRRLTVGSDSNPAKDCAQILAYNDRVSDGYYWIDPNGGDPADKIKVFCDMTHDGKGWTQFAKFSSTNYNIVATTYSNGFGVITDPDYVIQCSKLTGMDLGNAVMRLTMGSVKDYYKPISGENLCTMLPSYTKHLWSPVYNGTFIAPTYYSNHFGGSALNWPSDGRKYLSFWGGGGAITGCCHLEYAELVAAAWNKPFNLAIRPTTVGAKSSHAAKSCMDILEKGGASGNGIYWIDPDGWGGNDPFQVYCDMTTAGGGWTLVSRWDRDLSFNWSPALPVNALRQNINGADLTTIQVGANQAASLDIRPLIKDGATHFMHAALDLGDSSYDAVYFSEIYQDVRDNPENIFLVSQDSNGGEGVRGSCVAGWSASLRNRWFDSSWNPLGNADLQGADFNYRLDKGEGLAMFTNGNREGAVYASHNASGCAGYGSPYVQWGFPGRDGSYQAYTCNGRAYVGTACNADSGSGNNSRNPRSRFNLMFIRRAPRFRSCLDILQNGESIGNGVYIIDPDGAGLNPVMPVYCDMTSDGGGWTLLSSEDDLRYFGDGTWQASNTNYPSPYHNLYSILGLVDTIRGSQPAEYKYDEDLGKRWMIFKQTASIQTQALTGFQMLKSSHTPNMSYLTGFGRSNTASCYIDGNISNWIWCVAQKTYYSTNCGLVTGYWTDQHYCDSFRLAFWIREDAGSFSGSNYALSKGSAYGLRLAGSKVIGMINGKTISADLTGSGWNHLVMTYNRNVSSNNLNLYINSVLKAQATISGTIPVNASSFLIGSNLRGRLDEVLVYSSALTDVEVRQRYEQFSGGLVGRWDWSEGLGLSAADATPFGNSGTLKNGVKWVASTMADQLENWEEWDNALEFDGVNDSVTVATGPIITGSNPAITYSAWINPVSTVADWRSVLYGVNGGSNAIQLAVDVSGTKVKGYMNIGTWHNVVDGTITPNSWNYVVVSYDGRYVKTYVNGRVQSTLDQSPNAFVGLTNFWIGSYSETSQFYGGRLDRVEIYTRALSDWEVARKYQNAAWGLLGRWKFDESSGTQALDSSGLNKHATITGPTRSTSSLGTAMNAAPTGNMLDFDGVNDYVNVAIPAMPQVSVMAWYKLSSSAAGSNTILRMDNDDLGIMINPSDVERFHVNSWSSQSVTLNIPAATDGLWHSIGLTFDGWLLVAYFDGQKVGQNNGSNQFTIGSGNLRIGTRDDLFSEYFKGSIDQVSISDDDLSPQQMFYKANLIRQSAVPLAVIANPANDASFALGQAITFSASGSSDSYGQTPGIVSYFWDFDDGTPILKRDASVTVTYTTSGDKQIFLWVIDADGNPNQPRLGSGIVNVHITSTATLFNRVDNFKKKR